MNKDEAAHRSASKKHTHCLDAYSQYIIQLV